MKFSRQSPMDKRAVVASGHLTEPWTRWTDDVGQALHTLQTEIAAIDPLDSGATLADTITAFNELLVALKRIAP
jgi:hypothetical protein